MDFFEKMKEMMINNQKAMFSSHINSLRSFHFNLLAASIAQTVGLIGLNIEEWSQPTVPLILHISTIIYFAVYYWFVYIKEHWEIRSDRYYEAVLKAQNEVVEGSKSLPEAASKLESVFTNDLQSKISICFGLLLASIIPILFITATIFTTLHFVPSVEKLFPIRFIFIVF